MPSVVARRLSQNPLITVRSSATLGGNVNGATVIRVPSWIERPLGRYYMYFANHMGTFIRLAYANDVTGPWTIHEPGVLKVEETAMYRPQPDPQETLADFYTLVASPEIVVDESRKQLVMLYHGWWTNGERWPAEPAAARAWARGRGYGQMSQAATSTDGLRFEVKAPIIRPTYLRVFTRGDQVYAMSRLGAVARGPSPLGPYEAVSNPFDKGPYAGRVRHVGLLQRGQSLLVFFTAIGDAPERVMLSTIDLSGHPEEWRASTPVEILRPEATYECADLPIAPSEAGDIDVPARQLRDPFVFSEAGRDYLFYATCGEQGIAVAELSLRP